MFVTLSASLLMTLLALLQVANVGDSGKNVDLAKDELAVWSSPLGCETVVSAGRRLPRDAGELRITTWNIRWFPDGNIDANNQDGQTDLAWLGCSLTWMNTDLVALQEIRTHNEAVVAMEVVIDDLESRTGDDWESALNTCGSSNSQHVGFLWNKDRVTLGDIEQLWHFNAKANANGSPCASSRRPGLFASATGEGTTPVDFSIVSVHLKSGTKNTDLESREASLERIDEALSRFTQADGDLILLGDFNTMGTASVDPKTEIENLEQIAQKELQLRHPDIAPQCTEYFRGNGGWLDHVLITQSMQEAPVVEVRVSGYCALANCDRLDPSDMPLAYKQLSDHCPLTFEITNSDQD